MSLYDIPDHPVIRNMERTGYPDGKAPEYPICPECTDDCGTIYLGQLNEVIGCDGCIDKTSTEEGDGDCPECGAKEPEDFYKKNGEVVGCESCITAKNAWEWAAEERENQRW